MSYKFSELIQSAVSKMGTLAMLRPNPIATSGGTALIVDTTLNVAADSMKHGTAIITRDAGGAAAAPENEMGVIQCNETNCFEFTTGAFSAAVAVGDEIMVIRPKYPLSEWRRYANLSLRSFGDIPLWDKSITLVNAQTEYTLPAGVIEPINLYRQTFTTAGNYQWAKVNNWQIEPAVPGTARCLWIPEREVVGDKLLGIEYYGPHPAVYAWNDPIEIPIELAAGKLAWEMINRGGITAKTQTQADKILAELNDARQRFKIPNKTGKQNQFLTWR